MEVHFPLILDGATGTELQKRGFTGNICSEQWCLENPDAIIEIQRSYVQAGSQIVYAPTFSANRIKLEENKIINQVADYNTRLTGLSRMATAGEAWVAGDMAPTGKFLAPMGDVTFEELVDIYREQAAALEAAGVDLFVVETMMTLPEARAAVLAVKSVSKKPVFVTFTCDENGKTLTGTDVIAALLVMQGLGADAFGLNCSVGPGEMLKQIRRLQPHAEVPLIAKPNAGMPEIIDGKAVYSCTPEDFTAYVKELAASGVAIFGGCCGTTPEHISALKQAVDGVKPNLPKTEASAKLPLATDKKPFFLPANTRIALSLDCDETIGERLEDLEVSDDTLISIRITDESQLAFFAENQYLIQNPLCIVTENAEILEKALRLYQGRAMYEGTLPEEALMKLQKQYGLIY